MEACNFVDPECDVRRMPVEKDRLIVMGDIENIKHCLE